MLNSWRARARAMPVAHVERHPRGAPFCPNEPDYFKGPCSPPICSSSRCGLSGSRLLLSPTVLKQDPSEQGSFLPKLRYWYSVLMDQDGLNRYSRPPPKTYPVVTRHTFDTQNRPTTSEDSHTQSRP